MDIVFILIGVTVGAVVSFLYFSKNKGVSQSVFEELLQKNSAANEKVKLIELELEERKQEITKQYAEILTLNREVTAVKTYKESLETQLKNQETFIENFKSQTKLEFENLANKILEEKTKTFNENTDKNLNILLAPLKDKLQSFEKTVDDKFNSESKERFALKNEIEKLVSMNDKMAGEAKSLTEALRGDSKVQGDWGELVLERILEASGLKEGESYETQSSHNSDDGSRFRPDVIINLPENKHMIIDSKVSLTAFDNYRAANDDLSRESAANEHIKSIEKHVNDLSKKDYSKLINIKSPEFVLMFIPIEPAYILAMQKKPEIADMAWKKGVAIVTSTTLLTTLKTVASIWRLEKQNKNAQEIAREGALLYDKFVGFIEDFEKIGKVFEDGRKQFIEAKSKLKDGNGNVFRKIERLKELGSSPSKKIKEEYLE